MNEENLEKFKQFIDSFARSCYIMGKTEGLEGNKDNNAEGIAIPQEILKAIIEDVINTKEEPEEKTEIGFNMEEIIIPEPPKVFITKEKEKELVKKFGLKNMEKLAKELKFHGEILNKVKLHEKSI